VNLYDNYLLLAFLNGLAIMVYVGAILYRCRLKMGIHTTEIGEVSEDS
jgi:hypothetical protein